MSTHSWWRRRRRYDVAFYMPFIGSILSRDASAPPGGAETQVLFLSKALAARGVRVAIIAYGRHDELPGAVDGVTIVPRAPYRKRRWVGKVVETFFIWRALWQTPSRTIVYRAAGLQLGLLALYARISGRGLIYSSANIVDFDPRGYFAKKRDAWLYEFGARRTDAIVVQTEEQIPMCERAFDRSPTLIKSICPLAEPGDRPAEAFLWVGRLVSYKCPEEYLDLARALPDARFWMVGVPPLEPDERPLAEAAIKDARSLPNVTLIPPTSHEEIGKLMSRAVASVNTATYEGMPNVLLEAWARGVPALVLSHDPGEVIVGHQLGGFAGGSRERFIELARTLWSERHESQARRAVAERCRAYIAESHSPEAVVDQWIELLGEAAHEPILEPPPAAVEPTCVA